MLLCWPTEVGTLEKLWLPALQLLYLVMFSWQETTFNAKLTAHPFLRTMKMVLKAL